MIKLKLVVTNREAYERNLKAIAPRMITLIQNRMLSIAINLQRRVIEKLQSGTVLTSRTGNLERSIAYSDPVWAGGVISTVVGVTSAAPYGKVHEYGGTIIVPEHFRTSKLGNRFSVRSHSAKYKERSFLRSTLAENQLYIRDQLQEAVNEAVNE